MTLIPESAEPARFGFDPRRLARIRGWMERYVEAGKLPGALTLVARSGSVVWCDSVGLRDVERGLPWERGSLVRIYSMTKPVTATALMMLWEEGLCHLDDPLDAFFRERILGPLGMDNTAFAVPEDKTGRLACLYRATPDRGMELAEDGPGSRFRDGAVNMFSGGGGLVSTADDYLRFAEMQRRGGALGEARILGPRTVRLMASNHLPGDLASMGQKVWAEVSIEGVGFGLMGWVLLDPARAQILGSPGDYGWGGLASTVYWVDPVEDMVVLFLTQLAPSSSHPIRKELRALVYSALVD